MLKINVLGFYCYCEISFLLKIMNAPGSVKAIYFGKVFIATL